MHFVYILYSELLDRYYIGSSSDVERRLDFHLKGGERFTSRTDDWKLVFQMGCTDRASALELEQRIKASKSRKSIQRWIRGPGNMV